MNLKVRVLTTGIQSFDDVIIMVNFVRLPVGNTAREIKRVSKYVGYDGGALK